MSIAEREVERNKGLLEQNQQQEALLLSARVNYVLTKLKVLLPVGGSDST